MKLIAALYFPYFIWMKRNETEEIGWCLVCLVILLAEAELKKTDYALSIPF